MITSKDNPIIKLASALGRYKKIRYEEQLFILENKHFIEEWIQTNPLAIKTILYTNTNKPRNIPANIEGIEIDPKLLSQISTLKNNPGIVAIVKMNKIPPTFKNQYKTILLLQAINKPSNIGAIIRNAVAFNCKAIILSKNCADCYHPEAIRAAAGTIQHINIYYLEQNISLAQLKLL